MCALGHYLEAEGVATTLVGLVRLHCVTMRPPRALWVPHEMGRPLGAPNNRALQRATLMAALDLLVADGGPALLTDFADEAPGEEDWRCPFDTEPVARWPVDPVEAGRLLVAEFHRVLAWRPRALSRLGRTTVGVAGLKEEALGDHVAAGHIAIASGKDLPASPIRGLRPMQALRFAVDDLSQPPGRSCLFRPSSGQPTENRACFAVKRNSELLNPGAFPAIAGLRGVRSPRARCKGEFGGNRDFFAISASKQGEYGESPNQ